MYGEQTIEPQETIRVRDGSLSATVQWPNNDWRETAIDGHILRWIHRRIDLFEVGAEELVSSLKGCADIVQGLAMLAEKASAGQIIAIAGENAADHLPWEAFEAKFLNTSVFFHPVRIGPAQGPVSVATDGPVRVAFLVGHEGPGAEFDRHTAIASLIDVIRASEFTTAALDLAANLRILDLATASSTDRRSFFQANMPHVVFYFGHGTARPAPSIRIGPGWRDWLTIEALASDAAGSSAFPHSWIFLACSVGQPGSPNEQPSPYSGPASPQAFQALARRGARAMLAMRTRIRPNIARLIGASVLESLSAGYPLELAAGFARKVARRSRLNDNYRLLDWATPAVWSVTPSLSPAKLAAISPTVLAAKLMRAEADDPGLGLSRIDGPNEVAAAWHGKQRIRASAVGLKAAEILARTATIGGALTARYGRPAILIPSNGIASFTQRLAIWSQERLKCLDPDERRSSVGAAMLQMTKQDLVGLEQLLAVSSMVLFLEDPPSTNDETAWSVLENAPTTTTVVIASKSPQMLERPGWTHEALAMEASAIGLSEACNMFPESMAFFAALEIPVTVSAVGRITGEPISDAVVAPFTIPLTSGVIMTGSARQRVRRFLGARSVAVAHGRVFEALQNQPPRLESDDILVPLRHLVGANAQGLVEYLVSLVRRHESRWVTADWLKLAQALGPVGERWGEIPPSIVFRIAGVLTELQQLQRAADWLDAIVVDDALISARRAHIMSEIAKSEGTAEGEERMWQEVDRAEGLLQVIAEAYPDNVEAAALLRDVRANRARLELYFRHNSEAAADLFRRLDNELAAENSDASRRLRSACLRNWAECLFEFSPFRENPERLIEAREHLLRAQQIASGIGMNAVLSEILYSAAKLDEATGDWPAARDHLDSAARTAAEAGHSVCKAISEMRLLLLQIDRFDNPFDFALFQLRLRRLSLCDSHAWARRFAAQSRLWAARRLVVAGNKPDARALLRANVERTTDPTKLRANNDRRVLAESYAGLDLLTPPDVQDRPWNSFKALSWAEDWLVQHGGDDREHYWNGGS